MEAQKIVEHDAFVRKIEKDKIIVDILSKSACLSCQLRGICSVSDIEEKEVEVKINNTDKYEKGDKVTVYISQNQGLMAVFWGYFLPFLIMVATLIIGIKVSHNEGLAGLASIIILLPYYFILYLFREKISKKYNFKLK